MDIIGKKIKEARKRMNMTQKDLAKKLNKSERMIQKYESSDVIPSMDLLKKIADILNMNLWAFSTDNLNLYNEYDQDDKEHIYKLYTDSTQIEKILEYFDYSVETVDEPLGFSKLSISDKDGKRILLDAEDITNLKESLKNTLDFEIYRLSKSIKRR
ncbi:hypothetical protein LF65_05666 [Clostridium beijerinckii]|uniref:HTH cro/C1-type domain-containing protein n=1 Tax=Clostridium beijerinckii TaxID=1520 RepID=A0A0B5QW53_CLOBE|nr:helix-turn-helix transcriptional regulator [Clostridium beijerinckii]AJH02173.1 hypothetical protein LF65_05666 [Clostridium beijerinckii]